MNIKNAKNTLILLTPLGPLMLVGSAQFESGFGSPCPTPALETSLKAANALRIECASPTLSEMASPQNANANGVASELSPDTQRRVLASGPIIAEMEAAYSTKRPKNRLRLLQALNLQKRLFVEQQAQLMRQQSQLLKLFQRLLLLQQLRQQHKHNNLHKNLQPLRNVILGLTLSLTCHII